MADGGGQGVGLVGGGQIGQAEGLLLWVAILGSLTGFAYKISAVPFHFWTPDIYQGAANETTGVIATLPKIGAVAVPLSILFGTDSFWQGVDVPGESLSHVIITKLPFAVPDDPLTARARRGTRPPR